MHCKLTILFFLILSCSNNKKINSSGNSQSKNFHFLPVQISYTGIALEDSMKYFVSQYFQSENIEIIDFEYAKILLQNEVKRAGSSITSKDPQERWNQLQQNERYVYNHLNINFRLDEDSNQLIDMGWSVTPWPQDFSRLMKGRLIFLKNHKISNAPPQDELRTLCDSIIYSKSLY